MPTMHGSTLTPSAAWGYARPVTGVPVIGFESPNPTGGQPPFPYGSRHFLRPWSGVAPMGGPDGEPQGSPVPVGRSLNPFGSAHPCERGLAVAKPFYRSLTMDTFNPGASAPMQATQPAVFQFHSTTVRTVDRDGQIWFVADDVAKALGYRESRDMTRVLDEDEAAPHTMRIRSENGTLQTREVTILSESGLYHALLKSREPEARHFRRWVTQEVLPAIRRNSTSSVADAQIPDALQKTRYLLTVYADGRSQITPLPQDAAVLSAKNKASMSTLMREFIPGEMLPDLMHIGLDRLARMVARGRNVPVCATPVDKEVEP